MSFILDSIKKAERERKLGQQVPSISIEYRDSHFEHDDKTWKYFWLILLGVVITALIVWIATYYSINKDHQFEKQLSEVKNTNEDLISNTDSSKTEGTDGSTHNIEMVSISNIHKSDLKAIKIINEEDDFTKLNVKNVNDPQQSILAERIEPEIKKQANKELQKPKVHKPVYKINPAVENEINDASRKQELVAIYSDLAEVEEKYLDEEVLDEFNASYEHLDNTLLEIRNANYVDSKISRSEESLLQPESKTNVTHKTAVSTGVPSFGELPYDIQKQIPDFNVSVHMFHEDPGQRRIRINGDMYTEGKYLQQDLALVEITRYGAVFDFQGRLFRLNVR